MRTRSLLLVGVILCLNAARADVTISYELTAAEGEPQPILYHWRPGAFVVEAPEGRLITRLDERRVLTVNAAGESRVVTFDELPALSGKAPQHEIDVDGRRSKKEIDGYDCRLYRLKLELRAQQVKQTSDAWVTDDLALPEAMLADLDALEKLCKYRSFAQMHLGHALFNRRISDYGVPVLIETRIESLNDEATFTVRLKEFKDGPVDAGLFDAPEPAQGEGDTGGD